MSSDRETQYKLFKARAQALCRHAAAELRAEVPPLPGETNTVAAAAAISGQNGDENARIGPVRRVLRSLVADIGTAYRSYPLLCSRETRRFANADGVGGGTTTASGCRGPANSPPMPTADGADAAADTLDTANVEDLPKSKQKKTKKKKKKPPVPKWKRELQERRGLRKARSAVAPATAFSLAATTLNTSTPGEASSSLAPAPLPIVAGDDGGDLNVCRRTVAVAFNCASRSVRWGLSGQLKHQRIHRSIWGKSLIKGRPRGTCAEFHVLNEALLGGEAVADLCLFVADLMREDVSPKPRCRNCLYVSRDATCLSDDLVFDGDVSKKAKFTWSDSDGPGEDSAAGHGTGSELIAVQTAAKAAAAKAAAAKAAAAKAAAAPQALQAPLLLPSPGPNIPNTTPLS